MTLPNIFGGVILQQELFSGIQKFPIIWLHQEKQFMKLVIFFQLFLLL